MTELEIREKKKKEIEDVLYQWNYYQETEVKYETMIHNLEYDIICNREKLPQAMKENIGTIKKINKITEEIAIKIIDNLEKKICRLNYDMRDKLNKFYCVRETFNSLDGDEKELLRAKYFQRKRGSTLYRELNYSKSGFISKKRRILEKMVVNISVKENNVDKYNDK